MKAALPGLVVLVSSCAYSTGCFCGITLNGLKGPGAWVLFGTFGLIWVAGPLGTPLGLAQGGVGPSVFPVTLACLAVSLTLFTRHLQSDPSARRKRQGAGRAPRGPLISSMRRTRGCRLEGPLGSALPPGQQPVAF